MTLTFHLFVLVLALVLLALAALKTPEPVHISFGWAGLFCMALSFIVVT